MREGYFPIIAILTILFVIFLSGCGQGKTRVYEETPNAEKSMPIECGTNAECYATAEVECTPAKAFLEYDDGSILDAEVRGVVEGRCNEYLIAKAPDDLAGLDAVCEVPLGLKMKGPADVCKYCEGQLIDTFCDES